MSVLQCGCVTAFGSECTRGATQEDLLCDECREGRGRNAVFVTWHGDDEAGLIGRGSGHGHHHHVNVGEVVLQAVDALPVGLRYRGDPERA